MSSADQVATSLAAFLPSEMEQDSADAEDYKISDLIFPNSMNFIFENPSASISMNNKLLRG